MVEVKNVSKRYGGKPVVDQVSVTIPKGSITSFIGPNGAGKSTLLSMISRLLPKDSGEILIDGREVSQTPSRDLARRLSILKQSNHVELRLTVKDLVGFGRFPHSQGRLTAEDLRHVEDAIRYMDLADIQNRYLEELSGGQRQRAFIAMVLAQDTDYILLDEPLNNLDMKHSVQIMRILKRLVADKGKTIVLVLHDINFASCYSDHIVALKNGRVVSVGPTEEIIQPSVLSGIYEMDIRIEPVGGQKICIYYS